MPHSRSEVAINKAVNVMNKLVIVCKIKAED